MAGISLALAVTRPSAGTGQVCPVRRLTDPQQSTSVIRPEKSLLLPSHARPA
ncbi:hypothetical protein ASPCADRAFT_207911 [Aspergillus carbonarius ITEM 5010]|uniref:Uncharacterized protein n=1 Tax=Aspergillus carbonarius (strain ITEM 5010) TaxID=602072 RepID=A0A1R3RLR9_ASPC5|nr:hypothetical protein ASPCADRAFT_207911 [Aspergillus carbonarius ITEM 5010]